MSDVTHSVPYRPREPAEKAFLEWAINKSNEIVASVSSDHLLDSTAGHHAVLKGIYAGRAVALAMLQPLDRAATPRPDADKE